MSYEPDVGFDFGGERLTADDRDPRERAEETTSGLESLFPWGVLVNDTPCRAADMG